MLTKQRQAQKWIHQKREDKKRKEQIFCNFPFCSNALQECISTLFVKCFELVHQLRFIWNMLYHTRCMNKIQVKYIICTCKLNNRRLIQTVLMYFCVYSTKNENFFHSPIKNFFSCVFYPLFIYLFFFCFTYNTCTPILIYIPLLFLYNLLIFFK